MGEHNAGGMERVKRVDKPTKSATRGRVPVARADSRLLRDTQTARERSVTCIHNPQVYDPGTGQQRSRCQNADCSHYSVLFERTVPIPPQSKIPHPFPYTMLFSTRVLVTSGIISMPPSVLP